MAVSIIVTLVVRDNDLFYNHLRLFSVFLRRFFRSKKEVLLQDFFDMRNCSQSEVLESS